MKGFLFLSLVGAALYGALVVSNDLIITAEDPSVWQNLGDPDSRHLRSWGSDLPALVSSNFQRTSLPLRKPDVLKGSSGSDHSQYSESDSGAGGLPISEAKSTSSQSGGTAYEPIEWTKVTLAAKAHSEASVSSPILRFYQLGTVLQVVSRQNGWVQVTDPTSNETGWVFERYLMPADGPTVTQTALATTTSKALTEPTRAKPVLSAKKRVGAPRPTVRIRESVALAQFDRRWERRVERRGGFGLFFFDRFARAE
jgi:hypothetical protein